MVKLATFITFKRGHALGLVGACFPYSPKMISILKQLPGCRWDAARHWWWVPEELEEAVGHAAESMGWSTRAESIEPRAKAWAVDGGPNDQLYPYQKEDVGRFLGIGRAMFAWEMGLGKTLGGIESMRLSGARRILVVCPAMARGVWEDEIVKWWKDHPIVIAIRDGKEADRFTVDTEPLDAWVCVTSYDLLEKLRLPMEKLDFVLLDESHYVKNAKVNGRSVKRSALVRSLLEKVSPSCRRLFLTGTPITTEPIDLHNQGDLLYPGRLGSWWQYANAYCGQVPNEYSDSGMTFTGINKARADELYARLRSFVFRRTKAEPDVAKWLPPLITQTVRLRAKRTSVEKTIAELKSAQSKGDLDRILAAAGSEKIPDIVKMIVEDFEAGATHVGVFSWYKDTAKALQAALLATKALSGVCITHVDGDLPEKRRTEALKAAAAEPRSIVVGTIASVNVGINTLMKYSPAYAFELYGAPGIMNQWAGRFHRIGGASAVIRLVVMEGSPEEHIAHRLEKRMREHAKVIEKGVVEKGMMDALGKEESPAEFLKRWREAAKTAVDADEYGVV